MGLDDAGGVNEMFKINLSCFSSLVMQHAGVGPVTTGIN